MSDPVPYWWLWKPALDALAEDGNSGPLAALLRDHTLETPYPVRFFIAEMLDPISGSLLNHTLQPKRTNAASKRNRRHSEEMERIAVIQRYRLSGMNTSDAIAAAAEELELSTDRMWQHWRHWLAVSSPEREPH